MQNFLGPMEPLSAEKPSKGMLDVPVTNWRSLNLCSLLNLEEKYINFCHEQNILLFLLNSNIKPTFQWLARTTPPLGAGRDIHLYIRCCAASPPNLSRRYRQ